MINANEHRKNIRYEIKNLIWVSIKNIITNRLSKKLDHKMIESYSIIKIVDAFYQVQLFESVKIFNIFHFNLLRKTFENSLFEQINELASSIIINDEKEWKVNDIFDVRKYYRRVQFFVKWKKHDENKIWYDSKRFRNAFDIVKDFYDRYSDKSRSNWLKHESNQKIWWFKEENNVTNILFVLKSERDSTLTRAIESSRHRELASSKFRVASRNDETFAKWWKSFEMMTACFVMNKALHAAHLKHFEPSASWALNISSHSSFFFSFLLFSLVCSLSMTRHLLDSFIELIVTISRIRNILIWILSIIDDILDFIVISIWLILNEISAVKTIFDCIFYKSLTIVISVINVVSIEIKMWFIFFLFSLTDLRVFFDRS